MGLLNKTEGTINFVDNLINSNRTAIRSKIIHGKLARYFFDAVRQVHGIPALAEATLVSTPQAKEENRLLAFRAGTLVKCHSFLSTDSMVHLKRVNKLPTGTALNGISDNDQYLNSLGLDGNAKIHKNANLTVHIENTENGYGGFKNVFSRSSNASNNNLTPLQDQDNI